MRVVITGGRDYKDRDFVYSALDNIHKETPITLLIEGGAEGADRFGRMWGKSRGVYVATLWALWDTFGNAAGPLRNQAMIKLLMPEQGVAFPGNNGTANMVEQMNKAGIPVLDLR
jgi:hypothetical protein